MAVGRSENRRVPVNLVFSIKKLFKLALKMAFIQKVLMHLSFLQTDEPHYFPELEFWICDISKGSNHVKKEPEVALKAQIAKWSLI